LNKNFFKIDKEIQKQKHDTWATDALEIVAQGANTMMIVLIILSVIVHLLSSNKRSSIFMVIMTSALQLVMYQALLNYNLPSNLTSFSGTLIPTVNFDILENGIDWEKQRIIRFNLEQHE